MRKLEIVQVKLESPYTDLSFSLHQFPKILWAKKLRSCQNGYKTAKTAKDDPKHAFLWVHMTQF